MSTAGCQHYSAVSTTWKLNEIWEHNNKQLLRLIYMDRGITSVQWITCCWMLPCKGYHKEFPYSEMKPGQLLGIVLYHLPRERNKEHCSAFSFEVTATDTSADGISSPFRQRQVSRSANTSPVASKDYDCIRSHICTFFMLPKSVWSIS